MRKIFLKNRLLIIFFIFNIWLLLLFLSFNYLNLFNNSFFNEGNKLDYYQLHDFISEHHKIQTFEQDIQNTYKSFSSFLKNPNSNMERIEFEKQKEKILKIINLSNLPTKNLINSQITNLSFFEHNLNDNDLKTIENIIEKQIDINKSKKIKKINLIKKESNALTSESTYKVEIIAENNDVYYSINSHKAFETIEQMLCSYSDNDNETLEKHKRIPFEFKQSISLFKFFLGPFIALHSFIFIYYIITNIKRNSSKIKSKISSKQKSLFTFKDVAGNEEEKEEMKELIDFLKNPSKYTQMGAVIPKGVLLEGPPGTGKTLLAKALAGEANVPFYAVSGSEIDGILVGLGAAKLKTLFAEIKDNAPCVLFIDEIDSLGKKRGMVDNKHEQTLNQLLTEMDGFTVSKGIIVVAATNRIDTLDSALLRPGRFDRIFKVGLPDLKAREAILKVHARNKKLSPSVNWNQLAKQTPGMSGAQLGAVLNEASILTVRNQKEMITMIELEEAIDRVLMGPAKKSIKYNEEERKMVAYHEAGHAVIGLKLPHALKVQKITIIPRGNAGGYNLMLPQEETFFSSQKRMLAQITSFLGGRVAEELIFDDLSSGAYDDFKQATKIARLMVTKYGMSSLGVTQDSEFSNKTLIDTEIKKIVDQCYQEAKQILTNNKPLLEKIVTLLLEQETITKEEIEKIMKG